MSARRIIVERPIADEFTSRLAEKTKALKAGDPKEHDTIIGPLINDARARRLVKRARRRRGREGREGARRRRGRRRRATRRRCSPTCPRTPTSRGTRRSARSRAIEVVDSADEAVARANATTYGLSSGIITTDPDRGFALAQQIEAGIVHVNDQPVGDEPQMPFGGVKDSRLRALRRPGGDRRVHRAPLDHRPERHAPLPVLSANGRDRRAQRRRSRSSCATATSSRSRASRT